MRGFADLLSSWTSKEDEKDERLKAIEAKPASVREKEMKFERDKEKDPKTKEKLDSKSSPQMITFLTSSSQFKVLIYIANTCVMNF